MRVGKQMQFFGARVNLAKGLLYAINGGRDEITGEQVGAERSSRSRASILDFDDVVGALRPDDGLARRDLRGRAELHPLHARQVRLRARSRWRCTTTTSCAPWPAASPASRVAADSPVRDQVRHGDARPRRDRARGRLRRSRATSRSSATTTTASTTSRSIVVERVHEQDPQAPDLPRRACTRSRC